MPQFRLHQYSRGQVVVDEEGARYTCLEAAIGEAAEAAREIMADRLRRAEAADGSEFHITDEADQVVAVIKFEDVLAGKQFPPAPPIGQDDG
ncbi:MAG: hypothetical protein JWN34_2157 [Bryobacterales bacterium]|nr:hypothetical protein [Bryobacterales bacterium]